MDNEWWKKVEEAYHAARELSGEERSRFLDAACKADAAMRRQIEVLLQQDENPDSFLNRPAVESLRVHRESEGARRVVDDNTTISHYRILSRLGAGGMGEVYLAEDTRLNRKVALKFLPAHLLANQQAKKRLIREAQAAAALDHPNICTIHEVGEEGGLSFIVMQYVEGETLAGRIGNPLEISEALDIAVQVADALAEAHSHLIIHRDIKPENIMITPRGQAKIMDFGLARAVLEREVAESRAETESRLTEP